MSVVLTGTESTVVEDHCSSNLKVCFSLLPGNDCVRLFFRRRKWGRREETILLSAEGILGIVETISRRSCSTVKLLKIHAYSKHA